MAKKTTSTKKTSATGATRKQSASTKSPAPAKKKTTARKSSAQAAPAASSVPKAAATPSEAGPRAVKEKRTANARTTLSAKVDIGFGNTLYIRGEGPQLSWDRGVPMDCVNADEWEWSSNAVSGPVVCKVLINDEIWSTGEDFRIPRGERLVCYPSF